MADRAEMDMDRIEPRLLVDGEWLGAEGRDTYTMFNPATGSEIAVAPKATAEDLDRALLAVARVNVSWKSMPARDRGAILKRAADLLRQRADTIARRVTIEMGKPFPQARIEVMMGADELEWLAEEGRRTYGRIIPDRHGSSRFHVVREPIGPTAAFAAWNFPIVNAVRKLGTSLAAGCPCIYKPGEEVVTSSAFIVQALIDAGLPKGVIAFVFGNPDMISRHLIASPIIRKISFTGSVPVGRHLSVLSAEQLKRTTMELGGHAPVLVFDDADIEDTLDLSVQRKIRNAGQVCTSPTRFYVQQASYDAFCSGFAERAKKVKVGNGLEDGVEMGPLIHQRRLEAVSELVQEAVGQGAILLAGGGRSGNVGNFFEPTVLADVPETARIMNEEPFGPVALINRFSTIEDAISKANRLPFGLAAYAFTRAGETMLRVGDELEAGMVSINSYNLTTPEAPFGGIKDSGNGSEIGIEGFEGYLTTKTISLT